MATRWRRARTLVGAVVYEIRTEKLTFVAGSIAYHAFVSLLPLLLLALAVVTTVGNRSLEAGFLSLTRAVLTPGASEVFVEELREANQSAGLSVVGLAVLVWGTLRIFRGLDTAFSAIYESEAANSFVDQIRDGVLVLVTFGLAVVLALLIQSVVPTVGGFGWVINRAMLVLGLILALSPIYYVFPDEDLSVLEIVPGVFFAAVGLTAFESAFRYYVAVSSRSPDSSVVAALLVLLTWLYFSGLVILVGAAINAVTSNRSADVNVVPWLAGVDPGEKRGTTPREELVAGVERVDSLLADAEEMVIEVDGTRVRFPAPSRVRAETAVSGLLFGNDPVKLDVEWLPAYVDESGEAVAAVADGSGGEDDRE